MGTSGMTRLRMSSGVLDSTKWTRWSSVLSIIFVALAFVNHVTSPRILSTPGGFVSVHLFSAALSMLALAFAKRRWVVALALLIGLAAIYAASKDHDAGMEYQRRTSERHAATSPTAMTESAELIRCPAPSLPYRSPPAHTPAASVLFSNPRLRS